MYNDFAILHLPRPFATIFFCRFMGDLGYFANFDGAGKPISLSDRRGGGEALAQIAIIILLHCARLSLFNPPAPADRMTD